MGCDSCFNLFPLIFCVTQCPSRQYGVHPPESEENMTSGASDPEHCTKEDLSGVERRQLEKFNNAKDFTKTQSQMPK